MTREEAARILDPETSREALNEIEYYGGFSGGEEVLEAVNEACRIAAQALRDPPAHIGREAWEPCGEMCRNNCATCGHNADELFGDADYCKDCHRYSKWESSIHKYCERCGRPRTPEAWTELEKRMGVRV